MSNLHYVFDGQKFLCAIAVLKDGSPLFLDETYIHEETALPRGDKYNPSLHELVKTFNSPEWRKMLKTKIKDLKDEITKLHESRYSLHSLAIQLHRNYDKQELTKAYFDELLIQLPIDIHRSKIEWYEKLLYNAKQVVGKNGNTDFAKLIQTAKQVPISSLLDFNNAGFRRCIFHDEKTGSMKLNIKSNTVHCFGACGKTFDVIDVVKHTRGVDFKTAIQILNN